MGQIHYKKRPDAPPCAATNLAGKRRFKSEKFEATMRLVGFGRGEGDQDIGTGGEA